MLKDTPLKQEIQQSEDNPIVSSNANGNNSRPKTACVVLFILGILILTSIVIYGVFLLLKNTNEKESTTTTSTTTTTTSSSSEKEDTNKTWNTYKSDVFNGLTVQYPKDWKLENEKRYGINGFSFTFTNDKISWTFEPEYLGILEPSPTTNDIPFDWCIGGLIDYKYEYNADLYSLVSNNLHCEDTQQVVIYKPLDSGYELTAEDYTVLNEITESLAKE